MNMFSLKARACAGSLSLFLLAGAHAQAPQPASAMEAEYTLASSTTEPAGSWKFTKARLAITRLDDRHLLISMACEWKTEPKAGCDDWWTAQMRNGSLYLQDTNTEHLAIRFDPAKRSVMITRGGFDAASTVRTDIFQFDDQPTTDTALIRRMKRARSTFERTWKHKAFGHYSKWDYTRTQIPFAAQ